MRSATIDSDDQNTLLLSAQHSDEGDSVRLRKYRERKLRKLVDKCHIKNIRFTQYYVHISTKMAKDPSTCTDAELVELTTECLQALGSDYEPSGDSSSSDSSSEHIHKKVKVKKGFLTPTPKSFDRTNPYNQAWHTEQYNPCAQQFGYQRHQRQRLTPQQQHEIFQTQVCGQPSLEMCHELVFMSHFLGRNITLLSGKADEWKAVEDTGDDIILIYKGDNQYSATDVGTYLSIFCL